MVAGRLSDAFPELRIIIIENGPESKDDPVVQSMSAKSHGGRADSRTPSGCLPGLASTRVK